MKRILCGSIVLLATTLLHAQKKLQFQSQNYIGFLEGNNGSAFQFQTINGIQRGTIFLGLGTGLDWYLYRSIPVFLSLNKNLLLSDRTFFISLDGGLNYSWEKRDFGQWTDVQDSDFSPAFYGAVGIGYKAFLKNHKDAVIINLGYSYKRLKETQVKTTFCQMPPCPMIYEYYDYKTSRLSIRLGWQF